MTIQKESLLYKMVIDGEITKEQAWDIIVADRGYQYKEANEYFASVLEAFGKDMKRFLEEEKKSLKGLLRR